MRTNGFEHLGTGQALLSETRIAAHDGTRGSFSSIGWLLFAPFLFLLGIDSVLSLFGSPLVAWQEQRSRHSGGTHLGMPHFPRHAT